MASDADILEQNQRVLNAFGEHAPETMRKKAADTVDEYTRVKMREEGFLRKILPPMQIGPENIDRLPDTDKPYKIVDKEVDNAMAFSMPFGDTPPEFYIYGNRYVVTFDRIETHRYTKDVAELYTYHMDIRQVLSDNVIKDMMVEEDGKFIMAVNAAVGAVNTVNPYSGAMQNITIAGGITRDTLNRALKVLPATKMRLPTKQILINNLTINDIQSWGRDEIGGDLAQEIMQNGFTETRIFGIDIHVTIKNELVPSNVLYMFSTPDKMGKFYTLEDVTMYVKKEAYIFTFFAYSLSGFAIGNSASCARVEFTV